MQSILQMNREKPVSLDSKIKIDVITQLDQPLGKDFNEPLGFSVINISCDETKEIIDKSGYQYIVLFESSGMYHGGDIIKLLIVLSISDLDSVWGSRRLSVNEINKSYKVRYRKKKLIGAVSYLGSHFLSLIYLILYGRYISDSLSGIRVIRSSILCQVDDEQEQSIFNQNLLSSMLGRKAEVLEVPVRFFSQSPKKVKRTRVTDGLKAVLVIVKNRIFQK